MSVIFIEKEDIASAWLEAMKRVLEEGDKLPTFYDKVNDLFSSDSTVMIHVKKPFSNPMKNLRSKEQKILKIKSKFNNIYEIYGHMGDFCLVPSIQSGYIEECLEGVFDENLFKSKHSYPYSYHNRLFHYTPFGLEDIPLKTFDLHLRKLNDFLENSKLDSKIEKNRETNYLKRSNDKIIDLNKETNRLRINNFEELPIELFKFPEINQIEIVIKGLKESPISRRIQAITWRPLSDPFRDDPPCLQRLHFRIKNDKLIMASHWRSRDLYKAWQSNVNAMIRIQKYVADRLDIEVGSYIDISNSLHIYGRDIIEAKDLIKRENIGKITV